MMDDLDKLIAAVEAGEGPGNHALTLDTLDQVKWCVDAWRGSLDAALHLHGALLPGWDWDVVRDGERFSAEVWTDGDSETGNGYRPSVSAFGPEPARAWLLAILRAVKAQQSPGTGGEGEE